MRRGLALYCLGQLAAAAGGALHLVTTADRFESRILPMQLSAFYWGHNLRVLGMSSHPEYDPGNGDLWGRKLGWKLLSVLRFAKGVPDEDVILFVDAFDVLLLDPPAAFLEKFARIAHRTGARLVAAAEQNPGFRASDHPNQTHRWRYLNSGAMIGTSAAWRKLMRDPPPAMLPERYVGDQDWIIDVYLNTSALGGLMRLDAECELFQVTCRVRPVLATRGECPPSYDAVVLEGGRAKNVVTGTQPSLLHLSGPGHWPVAVPGRDPSCHYYEVARVLLPEVILPLESAVVWSGKPYSAICQDDVSLVRHVVLDVLAWASVRAGALGAVLLSLWALRALRCTAQMARGSHSHSHEP
mmetsp:Transcript_89011/g.278810  ORF Transcript_89011/g.278810 Transcript_89011/m.278810 type:complete len:355 (-) Transcript_89011:34-1098(-)